MSKTHDILQYLVNAYQEISGHSMTGDEMKAHKLMYYAQKTSFALTGKGLFEEEFEGWVHGPVLPSLRGIFEFYTEEHHDEFKLTDMEKYIIENTIYSYGQYATWSLRNKSHEEPAWIKSRVGLAPNDRGSYRIAVEDIKKDAQNVRIYDYEYDMYVDEFEDADEDFICAG